jgi:hypothetical protein
MVRTVPALLAVAVANTAAVEGTGGIAEEINGGTLEQTRLSPAGPQLQALGRMTALAVAAGPHRGRRHGRPRPVRAQHPPRSARRGLGPR